MVGVVDGVRLDEGLELGAVDGGREGSVLIVGAVVLGGNVGGDAGSVSFLPLDSLVPLSPLFPQPLVVKPTTTTTTAIMARSRNPIDKARFPPRFLEQCFRALGDCCGTCSETSSPPSTTLLRVNEKES